MTHSLTRAHARAVLACFSLLINQPPINIKLSGSIRVNSWFASAKAKFEIRTKYMEGGACSRKPSELGDAQLNKRPRLFAPGKGSGSSPLQSPPESGPKIGPSFSCVDFSAGPGVPPMAEIALGCRPCTLAPRPAPQSTATHQASTWFLLLFSGNGATKFSEKSACATLKFECPVPRAFTLRQATKLRVRIPAATVGLGLCRRSCRARLLIEYNYRALVDGLRILV
jgi:hypothetical protein